MKVSHKFIAVLLAVALITQPFTFMAYAAEQPDFLDQTTVSSDTPEIPIKDSASDEAQIVSEVTEKRTENSKTFLLDNGTYLLASYGEPVHYKDSNGTWQDIDSTLGETGASGMPDVTDPLNPSSQSDPPSTADSEITSSAPNVSDPSSAADASDSLSTPNSLNPDAQAGTSRFFANKAGATKFNLTKTLKSANAISFSTEAYTLHWGLDGADTVPAEVIPDQTDVSSESYNDRFLKLRKLHSAVEYKDALPGVDVQYLLSSGAVKENLVLNSRDTQKRFTETYQIGKLRAEQTDKRIIKLFDPSDSKQKGPVYTIAAPEMTDANGAISGAISLSILKQDPSQGTLQVELKTDEAWLNDPGRAYPVTIDPIVWSQRSTTRDTFISSGHPTENESSMGSMYLGNESSAYKTCRVLVNFDLPALPKGDMVVGAQLNIEQHSSGMSPSSASMQVNAYEMTSSWNEKTATWSNTQAATQTAKAGKVLDYFTASQSTDDRCNTWDITKVVKKWYNDPGTNHGIALIANDESASVRNQYVTSETQDPNGIYPGLVISYVDNAGLEDYWTYHDQPAGQAGTGSVNDYTGNLVFASPLMSETGEKVPLDYHIVYNGYHSGTHFENGQKGDIYGWGWQSNLSQRIDPADSSLESNYKYFFLDEDGTKHYFITDPNNSSRIIDENGLGMELTTGGPSDEYYTIKYKDGSKKTFTGSGYLRKIYDNENNSLTLQYYGTFLNQVTDGAGRTISIEYASSGAVTTVRRPDGKEIKLHYIGGNLATVTYPDGTQAQFAYDSSNRLTKATNIDGTSVQYAYYSAGTPMVGNRVQSAAEYSSSGAVGNTVKFTYNADNTTTFTYCKAGQSDGDAQKETFDFDNTGRTVSVLNADKSANIYTYTSGSTKGDTANKLTSQAQTSRSVVNMLLDHNAERNNGTWFESNWATPGGTFSVDGSTAYLGTKSLKITQDQENPQRSGAAQQLTNLTAGTVYTLSAYVRTDHVTSNSANYGAGLYAAFFNGSAEISNVTGKAVKGTNDWQRVSLTFTVPTGTTRVEVYGGLSYANGTAWFDCFQLETGSIANIYNMLENGDFYYSANYLPTVWGTTNFTSGDGMSGGNVLINGNSTLNKNIYQEVYINKPAGSIAFSVSAKSTGASVPIGRGGRYYAIDVGLFFSDGTSQFNVVDFNPDSTGEQYTSGAVAASSANQGKTITKAVYYIIYYNNANSAAFKFLQMNMDNTGTAYTYDSKGNLVASKQNAKNNASYSFTDANELATATTPNNESYSYTYDTGNKHRLLAARSNQSSSAGFTYSYDSSGNVTGTKMGTVDASGHLDTAQAYLEATQGYGPDGNYVTSNSDQRGKTTTYDVDSSTGLTNSATDPNGNTADNTFNPLNYLLTGISAQSSAGAVQNTYGYDSGNRVNKITHNGFDYTFTRDEYGNTTAINAGPHNLITNVFASGNGNLLTSTYGNGFKLSYFYDPFDRVTSIVKGTATAYLYAYDARGNLAQATDKTSGSDKVTTYFYDIGDRLVQKNNPDGGGISYSYDNVDRPTGSSYTFASQTKSTSYDYGEDNRKHNTYLASGGEITHGYNSLNREAQTDINPTPLQDPTFRAERTYVPVSGNRTTTLVDTYGNYRRVGGSNTALSRYQYAYDDNGNIKTVTDGDGNTTTYTYDQLNQLVRTDDQKANASTTYSYDVGGNITAVNTYAYTNPDEALGTATGTVSYAYGDPGWKDLLTNYNGQDITYDGIGNPLSYRDGMTFTWDGRQLKTAVANGKNVSYTYDDKGIRTGKIVDGTTTNYLLDGGTAMAQQTGDDVLWFLYDSDGTLVGFTDNGTAYYYAKDAQGDVTGIIDGSCNTVVTYAYDAWGKLLSTTGSLASTVGAVNPFLYHGYYYDSESGLYYLNSRYYDPQIGRFVSEDGQFNPETGLNGNNLFVYCNNRPINCADYDGTRFTEFDDGTGRSEYVDSTGFMHQGSGTKPITQKTSVKKQSPKPTTAAKKATAKNTGARDDFSTAGLVMTIQKTAITSIGALANLGKTESRILGAYGYVFSTPFAIFSHFYDPYLTTNQKWGLSLLEVGLAVGGIILAPALVGVSGALLGVGVAMLSYAISTGATDLCYNYNDRRREGE